MIKITRGSLEKRHVGSILNCYVYNRIFCFNLIRAFLVNMSESSNNLSEISLKSEGSSCTNTSCCPPPPSPLTRATPKIGRNDPCICGNGRKYKKCCGKNA